MTRLLLWLPCCCLPLKYYNLHIDTNGGNGLSINSPHQQHCYTRRLKANFHSFYLFFSCIHLLSVHCSTSKWCDTIGTSWSGPVIKLENIYQQFFSNIFTIYKICYDDGSSMFSLFQIYRFSPFDPLQSTDTASANGIIKFYDNRQYFSAHKRSTHWIVNTEYEPWCHRRQ